MPEPRKRKFTWRDAVSGKVTAFDPNWMWQPTATSVSQPTLSAKDLAVLAQYFPQLKTEEAPPETPTPETPAWVWYIPGQVLLDRKTGKFYDADSQAEISREDAVRMRNQYLAEPEPSAARMQLETERAREWNIRLQQVLTPQWAQQGSQQALADAYARGRSEALSRLTEPKDWIKRWEAENAPNPYVREPLSEGEQFQADYESLVAQHQHWLGVAKALEENPSLLSNVVGMSPEIARENAARAGIAVARIKGEMTDWRAGGGIEREAESEKLRKPRATAPPAPAWLQEFAPGQRTGQPITKERIAPPSLQQISRTPESVLAGLGGFAEYSGQSWQDILSKVAMMAPSQPRLGRTRWTPVG